MQWDGTITLGNVITALVFLIGLWGTVNRAYNLMDKRVLVFEQTIAHHAELIEGHAKRMEKQDDMFLRISGDLQRIVGRMESVNQQALIDSAAAAIQVLKAAEKDAVKVVAAAAAAAAAAADSVSAARL